MKKIKKVILIFIILIFLVFILNLKFTTRQGINYVVCNKNIPLYLKILSFLDRHFQYKQLTREIIYGQSTDDEKTLRIFEWTYKNIRKVPEGFLIIDDHVWHIIVRGYGTNDQSQDVFTTLCNYVGIDAFYQAVYTVDRRKRDVFSFVKIEGKWCIFEPYHGIYFKNKDGEIADVEEIKSGGGWSIESLDGKVDIDYAVYLDNLPSVKDIGLTRSNIQSPRNRLLFELKKLKKHCKIHHNLKNK